MKDNTQHRLRHTRVDQVKYPALRRQCMLRRRNPHEGEVVLAHNQGKEGNVFCFEI